MAFSVVSLGSGGPADSHHGPGTDNHARHGFEPGDSWSPPGTLAAQCVVAINAGSASASCGIDGFTGW